MSRVWEWSDADLLEWLLRFNPSIPPEPVLDATYNVGRFWRGSNRQAVSMDIDTQHNPTIVADNRDMIGVDDFSFEVKFTICPMSGRRDRTRNVSGAM